MGAEKHRRTVADLTRRSRAPFTDGLQELGDSRWMLHCVFLGLRCLFFSRRLRPSFGGDWLGQRLRRRERIFWVMANDECEANQRLRQSRAREEPTLRAINTGPRWTWRPSRRWTSRSTSQSASRRASRRRDPRVETFALVSSAVVFWIVSISTRCQTFLAMYMIFTRFWKRRDSCESREYWYQFNNLKSESDLKNFFHLTPPP